MTTLQIVLATVVAPVTSLMIVLAGYIVQNNNLNARTAEIRTEIKDLLRAELAAIVRLAEDGEGGVRALPGEAE